MVFGWWRGLDKILGASWAVGLGYDYDDEEGFAIKFIFNEIFPYFIGKVIQN